MRQAAISVDHVSKQYRIGVDAGELKYRSLRQAISDACMAPVRRLSRSGSQASKDDTVWVLNDVSFDVSPGEVIGLIGRNGSGKSTMLKILSRITAPTSGKVQVQGRIGSLLEVGTGFHPDLTGRENVFLNGSILGMKHREIQRQFDAIVEFADITQFLDTPVKRYSSGMYVRLAFAVAAHLNPEILLVDEVLAVGDVDFQRKCIGSMQSVANSGRTVVLVSHNLALIEKLCRSAVWLDKGDLRLTGSADEVVSDYVKQSRSWTSSNLLDYPHRKPDSTARFSSIRILDRNGQECHDLPAGSDIVIKLGIEADQVIRQPCVAVTIVTPHNQRVFYCGSRDAGCDLPPIEGRYSLTCHLKSLNLLAGRYYIDLSLHDPAYRDYDSIPSAAYFDIRRTDVLNSGIPLGQEHGLVYFNSRWELKSAGEEAQPVQARTLTQESFSARL